MDSLKTSSPQEAKLHFLDYWRIIRIRKTVILAVFLLVVITATVVTFILPESFVGSTRLNVQREGTDVQGMSGNGMQGFGGMDPYFIQTELEVMQSQVLLGKVVENAKLNLKERWATKYHGGEPLTTLETVDLLKHFISINPLRNTSLIEIRVYSDKPEDAAELANAIAEAYKEYRLSRSSDKMTAGIKVLNEQMDKKEKEFHEAQLEVARLRSELKVSDPDPASTGPSPSLSSATVQQLMGEVARSEGEATQLRTKLEALADLSKEKLLGSIQTVIEPDSVLSILVNDLDAAEQNLAAILKTKTVEHPDYESAKKVVDQYKAKIDDRVERLVFGLHTRLASIMAYITNQNTKLAEAKKADIEEAARTQPYWSAKTRLTDLQQYRSILQMKTAGMTTDLNLPQNNMVEILDKAASNPVPVRPNKPLNIILGVIIGLVVGIGLAFFIEYLDTSVKTVDDIEKHLGLPVLAVIPTDIVILLQQKRDTADAEAYRILKGNIELNLPDHGSNSYTLVSGGPGEGKSTTLCNLAYIYAKGGANVLVVDADLRRPSQHRLFDVDNSVGLVDYLHGRKTLEEITKPSRLDNLSLIPSGNLSMEDVGILNGPRMSELIRQLKQHYDVVFFDSPPILGVSDASILVSEVDNTIMVVQYRRFPRNMLQRVKSTVMHVGGNLIGVVLNNVDIHQDDSYRYYSNYKDYYSPVRDRAAEPKKLPAAAANGENEDAY